MTPATIIARFVAKARTGDLPSDSMIHRLATFVRWLDTDACIIRDQDAKLVPLRLNRIQEAILAKMMLQAAASRPVRIVVLKARKGGASTLVQALAWFLCAHYPNQIASMLAHRAESTDDIFAISKLISSKYTVLPSRLLQRAIEFPSTSSRYWCHTASGENVGAAGTPSILHLSEFALWHRNKDDTETAAVNAVPDAPGTIIVYESTARGRESFWDKFTDSHDPSHPYEPVFIPWYLDDRLRAGVMSPPLMFDDAERELERVAAKDRIALTPEALQWRRNKILDIGVARFRQEYPSTPEEAVQGQKDLVLPGLASRVIDKLPFDYESLVNEGSRKLSGGADFGYHDATAVVSSVYWDQALYIIQTYRAVEKLAKDHVEWIMAGHTYYCDPSAVSDREEINAEIRRQGIEGVKMVKAPRTNDPKEASIVAAEWNMVQTMLREDRLWILDTASDQILYEAENLFWNPKTGQPDNVRCQTADGWGHFDTLDALRYNVMGATRKAARQPVIQRTERRVSRREAMRSI